LAVVIPEQPPYGIVPNSLSFVIIDKNTNNANDSGNKYRSLFYIFLHEVCRPPVPAGPACCAGGKIGGLFSGEVLCVI
jgi:hypothetical protein